MKKVHFSEYPPDIFYFEKFEEPELDMSNSYNKMLEKVAKIMIRSNFITYNLDDFDDFCYNKNIIISDEYYLDDIMQEMQDFIPRYRAYRKKLEATKEYKLRRLLQKNDNFNLKYKQTITMVENCSLNLIEPLELNNFTLNKTDIISQKKLHTIIQTT